MTRLEFRSVAVICCAAVLLAALTGIGTTPAAGLPVTPIAPPADRAYPGAIELAVDAADVERRIMRVREHISGIRAHTVLLYPEWIPGRHAPLGHIDRLAGLRITAHGAPVSWTRDPLNVYAFHLQPAPGVDAIDVEFEYLSPTSKNVGDLEVSRDLMQFEWNNVLLYPAGYFASQIPVSARLMLPAGWTYGSALEPASQLGAQTGFRQVSLETLIDSPVYAGRYAARLDLDPGGSVPVHLNVFADRPSLLAITPEALGAHRQLVQQARKLFGSRHFAHYDFLYALTDQIRQEGLEHSQSSEDGNNPDSFTNWADNAYSRDLLAHEFTHSWNGKFRRPADLLTANYNVPMQDSLLWVYEGQTEYWGAVLAARSGLHTFQQALDDLALTAAFYEQQSGRSWRPLQDTTNDEITNVGRHPMSWSDWQRYMDYYDEGLLIWLEVDTLILERSQGQRSLDDFARTFFGINDGSVSTVSYVFADVVKALNDVQPYDWSGFLRQRLDSFAQPAPLEGLRRGGYRLVYTDTPSDYLKARDSQEKELSLTFSIGVVISDKDGSVTNVMRNSPAFAAQLTESTEILAVNGMAYSADVLRDAIRAAQGSSRPIELITKVGAAYRVVALDYHDGLRYPHLERIPGTLGRIDDILAPRK